MERKGDFAELNPITFTLKFAKKKLLLSIMGLLIYAASIVLGFLWFDWKLIVFVLMFTWGNNIGITTLNIMPIQEWIALKTMRDKTQEEIDKRKTPGRNA